MDIKGRKEIILVGGGNDFVVVNELEAAVGQDESSHRSLRTTSVEAVSNNSFNHSAYNLFLGIPKVDGDA
jgi:hypothetical protein